MKKRIASLATLFVSCGIYSNQSFAHTLSVPHTHTELAIATLFVIAAVVATAVMLIVKRRR